MKSDAMPMPMPELSYEQAAHYRREGYLVLPGVLLAAHVEACKAALSDLIQHFTDDKHSATRRRALQFHFCQAGAAWATSTIMPPCTATKRANTALASHRNMAKRRCASCVAKRKKPCCRWIGREAARQPMMH